MKFNAKKQISALLALVLSLSLVQPRAGCGRDLYARRNG